MRSIDEPFLCRFIRRIPMKKISEEQQKKINLFLYCSVTISFLVPIVFLIIQILMGDVPKNEAGYQ